MADNDPSASSALVRKRTDTQLMPPPPPAKRIQRPKTVLDEDTYTDGLSKIIARDFFPGLLESEAQSDYLSALDSKDQAWISSAGKRLRDVMTPGNRRHRHRLQTPSHQSSESGRPGETPHSFAGDTPASVFSVSTTASAAAAAAGAGAASSKTATGPDTNMSLGLFQSKYTSEDNESFYKLLDKQNQKRADKHAWLWNGNKLPSKMQLKQKEVEDRLIESGTAIVDDGYSKKDRLAIKGREDRPAAPETWKTAPKNALMFGPDGLDSSVQSVAEKAQADSRAPPKSIVYANTRLHDPTVVAEQQRKQLARDRRGSSVSRASGPPSPTLSAVRAAIAGNPRRQDADSSFGSIAGSSAGTATGGETPRVNGYSFVDEEESVVDPAESEPEPEPIIRFGKADSTPNPFSIQAKSTREGLHHRMVERIAHNKRTSARVGMTGRSETPITKYPNSPRVKGNLTPAGQRLWSNMTGSGSTQRDAVSSFNRQRGEQQKDPKGSRRARLREINAALRK